MAEKSKVPDWDALEKQSNVASDAANMPNAPMNDPMLTQNGVTGADAAGLGFIDKMSFGLLPYIHDKMVDWAPEGHKLGPKYADLIPKAEAAHPVASTIGGGAGMMLPIGGALRLAQGLKAIPFAGGALQGAAAVGGENVADQAVRTQTEGREFDPAEAGGAAALGAVNPVALAKPLAKPLLHGATQWGANALGPILRMARGALPEATAAAESALGGEGAAAARGAAPKAAPATPPQPPGPPPTPPPLAGEKPFVWPEGSPLSKFAGQPAAAPPPPPAPPPMMSPRSLLDALPSGTDAWTAGTRGGIESGVRVGSEDKKKNREREKARRGY